MSHEQEWEHRYQAGTTGWDRGKPSPALELLLQHSGLKSGRVLIPGAGRGYEVIELAQRGFEVTALDIAPSATEHLQAELEKRRLVATVIQTDMLNWEAAEPFDAVYEQTSLCALHPELWDRYSDKLYSWLKPDGLLLALWMQTQTAGGPPYHCEVDVLRNHFNSPEWRWSEEIDFIPHPSGRHEVAYILLKKQAPPI